MPYAVEWPQKSIESKQFSESLLRHKHQIHIICFKQILAVKLCYMADKLYQELLKLAN